MVRWINYKGKLCFDRCLAIRQSRNLIEKPSQRRSKICCFMRIFGRSFWSELPVSSQHSFSDKWKILLQKQRRELGLKRFWSAVKTSNSSSSQGDYESPPDDTRLAPNCSLPLLQVGSCYCSVARSVKSIKIRCCRCGPVRILQEVKLMDRVLCSLSVWTMCLNTRFVWTISITLIRGSNPRK